MINETKQLNKKMDSQTHTHIAPDTEERYRENGIPCKRLYNYKKIT